MCVCVCVREYLGVGATRVTFIRPLWVISSEQFVKRRDSDDVRTLHVFIVYNNNSL